MESKYLINPMTEPNIPSNSKRTDCLDVSEFFYDTIQGEGAGIGYPAAFLRLQGCTLDCVWCDTEWRTGFQYNFSSLFAMMESFGLIDRFMNGHRFILTGGSPLKQQERLCNFLYAFAAKYQFTPEIELENECTIIPSEDICHWVGFWNNSPKLASSGMKKAARYKPDVLNLFKSMPNVTYKFVVECDEDWEEILTDFIEPGFVRKDQIILMPLGDTIEELSKHRSIAVSMAVKYGVRYSTREQIVLGEL